MTENNERRPRMAGTANGRSTGTIAQPHVGSSVPRTYLAADVFVAERIARMFQVGIDLTIDDFRPEFELAQINPRAYGPLLAALARMQVLIVTGRCTRTSKPGLNNGLRRIYQLAPTSPARRGSGKP